MSKWFAVNGLSLNREKTKALHFKCDHLQNDLFQIFYQGQEIEEVTNTKFLCYLWIILPATYVNCKQNVHMY